MCRLIFFMPRPFGNALVRSSISPSIDRRNHDIFQPLLYQVAYLAPSDIAAPIPQLAARQRNASVMLAEVVGVDIQSRCVSAECSGAETKKIGFDYLVVASGNQSSYFGDDEFRLCPMSKDAN
jgi:NADH dehydrogenase